jgi:hypothetical protein
MTAIPHLLAMGIALAFAAAGAPRPDLAALRAAGAGEGVVESGDNLMPRLLPDGHRGGHRGDLRLAARCQAHCKQDRRPCRQPAIRGRNVCRMHGGKGGAPSGSRHGRFKHGLRTRETAAVFAQLRRAEQGLRMALAFVRANFELKYETVRRRIGPGEVEVTVTARYVPRPIMLDLTRPKLCAQASGNRAAAGQGARDGTRRGARRHRRAGDGSRCAAPRRCRSAPGGR